jgi:nitrite reductase/ring-hydroxylating ferredoxin subunit
MDPAGGLTDTSVRAAQAEPYMSRRTAKPVRLGPLKDIPDRTARGYAADLGKTHRKVVVYRDGETVLGFADACPHMGVPLPWNPDDYLTPDGKYLRCANHGALFDLDGRCVFGPCKGEALPRLELEIRRGIVWLIG